MLAQVTADPPRARTQAIGNEIADSLERVYCLRDVEAIAEFFADDYREHDPWSPSAAHGTESVRHFVESLFRAFPDLWVRAVERAIEGDTVLMRWAGAGTHTGRFEGIEATGKKVAIEGTTVTRFECGRAVEGWSNWEPARLFRRLGVSPYGATWRVRRMQPAPVVLAHV